MKNIDIIAPSTLSWMPELKPEEQMVLENIFSSIRRGFELHGFSPLDTHVMEDMAILEAKKWWNILYSVAKSGRGITWKADLDQINNSNEKQQLWLRFDLTVPATRYVVENFSNLTFPFRRYQIQKVYRGERPGSSRFNEFYQADIDIFWNGSLPISADVEVLTTMNTILAELEIGWYKIRLFNRHVWNGFLKAIGTPEEVIEKVLVIADDFPKVGKEKTQKELDTLVWEENSIKILGLMGQTGLQWVIEYLAGIDNEEMMRWLEELRFVYEKTITSGVPEKILILDASTIRWLDYYTGSVYETFLDGEELAGSICSGGRFDNLAEKFTTKTIPWVGMSIGVTRLFKKLLDLWRYDLSVKTPSQVLVTRLQEEYESEYLRILKELRQAGIPSELYLDEAAKLWKQLWYANDKWIPYAVVAWWDEFLKWEVQIKHMNTGKKEQAPIDHIVDRIKELLTKQIR